MMNNKMKYLHISLKYVQLQSNLSNVTNHGTERNWSHYKWSEYGVKNLCIFVKGVLKSELNAEGDLNKKGSYSAGLMR